MKIKRYQADLISKTAFIILCSVTSLFSSAQTNAYILNGNATQNSCNCYTLTSNNPWQGGSVWNANKIDLTKAFDFWFNVFLGCADANGADGIVFMLQPISTSIGTTGEGMGFEGVSPSIGIALDTWQNSNRNDPAADHISIQSNGQVTHGADLAGPVSASATSDNIEDCKWHTLRIKWDPSIKTLTTYFDGVMRLTLVRDIIGSVFNNDPLVFWGFAGATGGSANLQQFCTALNPLFTTNFSNNTACIGETISFQNNSESFAPIANYHWDLGDGTISTDQNPAPHKYSNPGLYNVKLAIKGMDGCNSDTLKKIITIGSIPNPAFEVFDTCSNDQLQINDLSTNQIGKINKWQWQFDGVPVSTDRKPVLKNLPPGDHNLQLTVESEFGCISDVTGKKFIIHAVPVVDAVFNDGCTNESITFSGNQIDNVTTVNSWNWMFGDNSNANMQNFVHAFTDKNTYEVKLWSTATNGCTSDTVNKIININEAIANAGNDTMVLKDVPFNLNGSGNGLFNWTPDIDLNNNNIANPVAVLKDDQQYLLTVTTAEGCTATDMVDIKVFKGSNIYVPNGFTPDGNGRNDNLKPMYIGIKKLNYFTVYNRWGQKVFTTTDVNKGWDGKIKGQEQATGTFVWIVSAEDHAGQILLLKGTTTLIR